MIVINLEGVVVGEAPQITRVNAQGEENLIKVNIHPDQEYAYFYIGTDDRDEYEILDLNTPDSTKVWRYVDGEFEEVIFEDLEDIE
jgi:hypothetical protein